MGAATWCLRCKQKRQNKAVAFCQRFGSVPHERHDYFRIKVSYGLRPSRQSRVPRSGRNDGRPDLVHVDQSMTCHHLAALGEVVRGLRWGDGGVGGRRFVLWGGHAARVSDGLRGRGRARNTLAGLGTTSLRAARWWHVWQVPSGRDRATCGGLGTR